MMLRYSNTSLSIHLLRLYIDFAATDIAHVRIAKFGEKMRLVHMPRTKGKTIPMTPVVRYRRILRELTCKRELIDLKTWYWRP